MWAKIKGEILGESDSDDSDDDDEDGDEDSDDDDAPAAASGQAQPQMTQQVGCLFRALQREFCFVVLTPLCSDAFLPASAITPLHLSIRFCHELLRSFATNTPAVHPPSKQHRNARMERER